MRKKNWRAAALAASAVVGATAAAARAQTAPAANLRPGEVVLAVAMKEPIRDYATVRFGVDLQPGQRYVLCATSTVAARVVLLAPNPGGGGWWGAAGKDVSPWIFAIPANKPTCYPFFQSKLATSVAVSANAKGTGGAVDFYYRKYPEPPPGWRPGLLTTVYEAPWAELVQDFLQMRERSLKLARAEASPKPAPAPPPEAPPRAENPAPPRPPAPPPQQVAMAEPPPPAEPPRADARPGPTVAPRQLSSAQVVSAPASSGPRSDAYFVAAEAGSRVTFKATSDGPLALTIYTPSGEKMLSAEGRGTVTLTAWLPRSDVFPVTVSRVSAEPAYSLSTSIQEPSLAEYILATDVGYRRSSDGGFTCWLEAGRRTLSRRVDGRGAKTDVQYSIVDPWTIEWNGSVVLGATVTPIAWRTRYAANDAGVLEGKAIVGGTETPLPPVPLDSLTAPERELTFEGYLCTQPSECAVVRPIGARLRPGDAPRRRR